MDVGLRLRTLRKLNKMSQQELAQLLGVSRQRVIAWEKGHSDLPEDKKPLIRNIFDVEIDLFDPGLIVEVKRLSGGPGEEYKYTLAKVDEDYSTRIYEFDLNKLRSLAQELKGQITSHKDETDLKMVKFLLANVVDLADERLQELKKSKQEDENIEQKT